MATGEKAVQRDAVVSSILSLLNDRFTGKRTTSEVSAYRYNDSSVRIRIVAPKFRKLNRADREDEVWKVLDLLPPDVASEITMLVLLAPGEERDSNANFEFEHPSTL